MEKLAKLLISLLNSLSTDEQNFIKAVSTEMVETDSSFCIGRLDVVSIFINTPLEEAK